MVCRIHHIFPRLKSSFDKPQDTYGSLRKSPLQAITFMYFRHSGRAASLHFRIFSHFNLHFRNLWQRGSLTVQSILEPLMYGMNMLGIAYCILDGWNKISGSGSWSELAVSSELHGTSDSSFYKLWFSQADFWVALCMIGLWIWHFRTLPINVKTVLTYQALHNLVPI